MVAITLAGASAAIVFAVQPSGVLLPIVTYGICAFFAAASFLAWATAVRLSVAFGKLDEALLKLRAFERTGSIDQFLMGTFERLFQVVDRLPMHTYLLPYTQRQKRYDLWRLTVGLESLAATIPAERRSGHIPELDALGELSASVHTVRSQLNALNSWTREFEDQSAALQETVRSTISTSIIGPSDVSFDGWERLTLKYGAFAVALDNEQNPVIRAPGPVTLEATISKLRSNRSDAIEVPVMCSGTSSPREIQFRVEARSAGLRPLTRSTVLRWQEGADPGEALLTLEPVQSGVTDLFITTYIGVRLLQTVRLPCRIEQSAVTDGNEATS